jgi:hypothetical protein
MLRSRSPAPLQPELPRQLHDEARVVAQVALREAPRLHRHPERPLQAAVLQPRRRLPHQPRVEVEGGPDPDLHQRQAVVVVGHPALLLGAAEAHEQHARARGHDVVDDGGVLVLAERPEGWGLGVHDPQAGEPLLELAAHAQQPLGTAAVEADRHAGRGRGLAQVQRQGGAVDARGVGRAEAPQRPHQRHAVRHHQVGPVDDLLEGGVVVGLHRHVHVGDADVAPDRVARPAQDALGGVGVAGGIDAHPEDPQRLQDRELRRGGGRTGRRRGCRRARQRGYRGCRRPGHSVRDHRRRGRNHSPRRRRGGRAGLVEDRRRRHGADSPTSPPRSSCGYRTKAVR